MRKLLLIVAFLALPTLSEAGPCTIGSLQSYIGLGATGCDLGGATFFGFDSDPSFAGGSEIAASDVTVTPFSASAGPQLAFGLTQSAGPGDLLGILIAYSISGLNINGASLMMTGASATGDGVATAIEDLCLGGTFGADPTSCSGTPTSLVVAQDFIGYTGDDTKSFAVNSFFDVFFDLTLDGGLSGSAAFTDAALINQFNAAAPAADPVPEPVSMLLVGTGLLGAAARRARKR